ELSANGRWLATIEPNGFAVWETSSGKRVLSFAQAGVQSLAFGPDNLTVATGLANGTVVIWDLSPVRLKPIADQTEPEIRESWVALTGTNAEGAYEATWRLAAAKTGAVPFLSAQLKLVTPVSEEHLQKLIAELDAGRYAVRESA